MNAINDCLRSLPLVSVCIWYKIYRSKIKKRFILRVTNIMFINREDAVSGIGSWDWNLKGNNSTYHALYPRAWTVYEGICIIKRWTFAFFMTISLDISSYRVITICLKMQVNRTQHLKLFVAKFHLLFLIITKKAAFLFQLLLSLWEWVFQISALLWWMQLASVLISWFLIFQLYNTGKTTADVTLLFTWAVSNYFSFNVFITQLN